MAENHQILTRAQESRAAIERIYIEMRHLFNRGFYKPLGASGSELAAAMLDLRPEIYGSMDDPEKVELDGLVYVMDRLPKGIEECRFVKLTSKEGYSSSFETIIPAKRRRNCYRIDEEQMLIEVTRGKSEIYDILTHLTFMYIEAEKIKSRGYDEKGEKTPEWYKLEKLMEQNLDELENEQDTDTSIRDVAFTYLSTILGRTFEETKHAYHRLRENPTRNNGLFHTVYWLGKIAQERISNSKVRQISFTPALRERIGRHIYGEQWATRIKSFLLKKNLIDRPLHIVSANLHSVMNALYAYPALVEKGQHETLEALALRLSQDDGKELQAQVKEYAMSHGMYTIHDNSGTNIGVQIFDTTKLNLDKLSPELEAQREVIEAEKPVIFVMDYAFGEQAYETMDELLKPLKAEEKEHMLQVSSISIMGKAGILSGDKGDLMIPTAHVFEGTADNYPFENACTVEEFEGNGLKVFKGTMISVLGTSLQNREVLRYFKESSWQAIGLEMEGAHYQKAIQAASHIRHNIRKDITLRYAYYASDNPLITGGTLASGSLGITGVRPTYLITKQFLKGILQTALTGNK